MLNGLVFGIAYTLSNTYAAARAPLASVAMDWERAMPFLPWMIVPYLSSGIFFAGSFFWLRTHDQFHRGGDRAEPDRNQFGPGLSRFGNVPAQDALIVFFVLPQAALQEIGAQPAGVFGGEEVHDPAHRAAHGVDPGERQFSQ